MLDIKLIRENKENIEKRLQTKDPEADLTRIVAHDLRIRELKTEVERLKSERNDFSKKIGEMKRKGEPVDGILQEVEGISARIHTIDKEIPPLEELFEKELAQLPNLPMDDVKISPDPKDNVVVKEFGKKPEFDFPFKNHLELNEKLGLFDFKRSANISGSGWPLYRGMGARLEWALLQYMVDTQIKNGFEFILPPLLVRPEVLYGSGQLPKFENQQFKITDEDYHLYLIPTAEVPLCGLHYDEILEEEQLPLKYASYSPCFRREAGAAGSSERGLIRMHQFNKVEMFAFTKPEESMKMFEEMVGYAEKILEGLDLHYRSMLLVTGDMSFAGSRTIDVETWLPGQDRYYEVSSVTNCTDFQARRARIRFRRKGEKPELIHTLNGSGLATSRLMVSLLECNQEADGSVRIPEALQPYMDGIEKLIPKKD